MNRSRLASILLCALPLSLQLAGCTEPVDQGVATGGSAQALLGDPAIAPIAGGNFGSLVRKPDGTVVAFGFNDAGQLGDGTTADHATPAPVAGLDEVVAVSAGQDSYALALKSDGTVMAWGSNIWHQLGAGVTSEQHAPVPVIGLSDIAAVAAANAHSLALRSDGTVWAWGLNSHGQIGDGTTHERWTAVQVSGLTDVVAIAAQTSHSLALKADGTVWAWGANPQGELGDGTTADRLVPTQIAGLDDIVAIATGRHYTLAVDADGRVFGWGANARGQLGDGTLAQRLTPVQVIGLSNVTITAVASAFETSLALGSNGKVYAWGFNGQGQIGDGTTTNRSAPYEVSDLSGVASIAAGDRHSIARKADGTVWTWGLNDHGQLGDGTLVNRKRPVFSTGMSVTIGLDCAGGSTALETIEAAPGCVNFSAATIAAGASYATLNGAGSYTLYDGPDCTGGARSSSQDTYFCGYDYDDGEELNDNARSISFP